MTPWRVAIIGGGSAGVASARAMLAAGHHPTLFDARSSLGGLWERNATVESPLYESLTTNLPTCVMRSAGAPRFPAASRSFVDANTLGAHIEAYAERFVSSDPRSTLRLGTEVSSVRPLRRGGVGASEAERWSTQWEVSWRDAHHRADAETFDAVVVATGHYTVPHAPTLPGVEAWLRGDGSSGAQQQREVLHSSRYRRASDYAGRTVLVVGARASGADIARELLVPLDQHAGSTASASTAHHVYLLDKGVPEPQRASDGRSTVVPRSCALRPDGRLALVRESDDLGQGVLDAGPPIDTVILATGYKYGFPFLRDAFADDDDAAASSMDGASGSAHATTHTNAVSYLGSVDRWVSSLFLHCICTEAPTLAFVGIPLAVPVPIPLFEAQANFVAAQWGAARAGRITQERGGDKGGGLSCSGSDSGNDVGDAACRVDLNVAAMRANAGRERALRTLSAGSGANGDAMAHSARMASLLRRGASVYHLVASADGSAEHHHTGPRWCAESAIVAAVHTTADDSTLADERYYTIEAVEEDGAVERRRGREVNTVASRLRVRPEQRVEEDATASVTGSAPAMGELWTFDRSTQRAWVASRKAAVNFDVRPQDLHCMTAGGATEDAWHYIRHLVALTSAVEPGTCVGGGDDDNDDAEFVAFCRRLALVEDVYTDVSIRRKGPAAAAAVQSQHEFAWRSDEYRRYAYEVDWAAGCWSVRIDAGEEEDTHERDGAPPLALRDAPRSRL